MKQKLILTFTLLIALIVCRGQNTIIIKQPTINDENKVWTKVENEAEFTGGQKGWIDFLSTNLKLENISKFINIPDSLKSISHQVVLRFIVGKDGTLSDIYVEKSSNEYCSKEALRVIRRSPKWIPALQNNKIVNAYRRQPITFIFNKE